MSADVWTSTLQPDYHYLIGRNEVPFEIFGRLVGYSSSEGDTHSHSEPVPPDGTRCSKCRWFEVRIFTVDHVYGDACTCDADAGAEHDHLCGAQSPDGRYLVLTYGLSRIDGERVFRRAVWTDSAFRVADCLTQNGPRGPFLPRTSAMALAEAAPHDEQIRAVYISIARPEIPKDL